MRLLFWNGIAPERFSIKVFTKLDFVVVNNVAEIDTTYLWSDEHGNPIERHSKTQSYNINGAAMFIEEIEHGRRYFCSDTSGGDKDFPFNDIIFVIKNYSLIEREPAGAAPALEP